MVLKSNDPRSKQRQIADDIRDLIASGVLTAGDRLPSTRELMEEYGVSNQTVQGGLRYLSEENVTHGVPGRGTFVRDDVTIETLSHDEVSGEPSAEYVALRSQLETLAAEVHSIRQQLNELADDRVASKPKTSAKKQ